MRIPAIVNSQIDRSPFARMSGPLPQPSPRPSKARLHSTAFWNASGADHHEASDRGYAHIGIPETHHSISHHGNEAEKLANLIADVLARIAGIPQGRLHELLPWEWQKTTDLKKAAA